MLTSSLGKYIIIGEKGDDRVCDGDNNDILTGTEGAEKISGKMVTMCFSKLVILLPAHYFPMEVEMY